MTGLVTSTQLLALFAAPSCAFIAVSFARLRDANAIAERVALNEHTKFSVAVIVFALLAGCVVAGASDFTHALRNLALVTALGYLAAFDLRYLVIPVWPTLAFATSGIAIASFDTTFVEHAAAAALGWSVFRVLDFIYERLRGRSGLGAGDALVALSIGAWLSFEGLAFSVAIGGVATLLWRLLSKTLREEATPLVPGLAFGALIFLLVKQFLPEG